MPQQPQNNMKGTSPSKLIQQGIDQSWGQQQQDSKTAQEAISKQFNKHPIPPGSTTDTK